MWRVLMDASDRKDCTGNATIKMNLVHGDAGVPFGIPKSPFHGRLLATALNITPTS
jgi:hypothetical protein